MPRKKIDRVQQEPISYGGHTLIELAILRSHGQSWEEIAGSWKLRPKAGVRDLLADVWRLWEQAGAPGGGVKPTSYDPESHVGWDAWVKARAQAIDPWLSSLVDPRTRAQYGPFEIRTATDLFNYTATDAGGRYLPKGTYIVKDDIPMYSPGATHANTTMMRDLGTALAALEEICDGGNVIAQAALNSLSHYQTRSTRP